MCVCSCFCNFPRYQEREVVALRCLHKRGEFHLASYNNSFSSRHDAWFGRKFFRTFSQVTRETTPSRYNGAILNKFVVFLKSVQLFLGQLGRSKEEEGLRCVGSFAKVGWKLWRSGNGPWGSGNGLWLAYRYRPRKGHCRLPQDVLQACRGEVEAFSPLART